MPSGFSSAYSSPEDSSFWSLLRVETRKTKQILNSGLIHCTLFSSLSQTYSSWAQRSSGPVTDRLERTKMRMYNGSLRPRLVSRLWLGESSGIGVFMGWCWRRWRRWLWRVVFWLSRIADVPGQWIQKKEIVTHEWHTNIPDSGSSIGEYELRERKQQQRGV
jgi:hypothetical protein